MASGYRMSAMSELITMGLDLSLRSTGVCVWDGDVVYTCTIQIPDLPGQPERRIHRIAKRIREITDRYDPVFIAIEGYAFSRNNNWAAIIHELGGVVKNRLYLGKHLFTLLPPNSLKLYATGNGRASKEDMIRAAAPWLETRDDNQADALHL